MPFNLISDLNQNHQPDLNDRGLHYGDGLFETMLLDSGNIQHWSQHYQRLTTSATRLDIDCPDQSWFDKQLQSFIELDQTLVIKIMLTRGTGGRGLQLPDDLMPNVYILHYPYSVNDQNPAIAVTVSDIKLPRNKNLAGIKHLNRLDYILATQSLNKQDRFQEALLVDTGDSIIESIVHNLFFVIDHELCTPDLSECGVDGIFRNLIIKKLEQARKPVKIGRYGIQDVLNSDECFLCNSVQGIRPIIQIDESPFSIGPITKQLQQEFHGPQGN